MLRKVSANGRERTGTVSVWPLSRAALIARCRAGASSAWPSPTAPKSFAFNCPRMATGGAAPPPVHQACTSAALQPALRRAAASWCPAAQTSQFIVALALRFSGSAFPHAVTSARVQVEPLGARATDLVSAERRLPLLLLLLLPMLLLL